MADEDRAVGPWWCGFVSLCVQSQLKACLYMPAHVRVCRVPDAPVHHSTEPAAPVAAHTSGLHAHGVITQPALQPGRLETLLAADSTREVMLDFLDTVMTQAFPSAPTPSPDDVSMAQCTQLPTR